MRLEHNSGEHGGTEPSAASGLRLTEEQLQTLLNDAIARQGHVERLRERPAAAPHTLEEAFEIARQLNIPEEYVVQSMQAMVRRLRLPEQREAVRRRRQTAFFVSLMVLGVVFFLALLRGLDAGGLIAVLLVALVAGMFGWKWLRAPVTDAEAERVELAPKPGVCRVCGAPAQNERSTFCAAHQYQVRRGS